MRSESSNYKLGLDKVLVLKFVLKPIDPDTEFKMVPSQTIKKGKNWGTQKLKTWEIKKKEKGKKREIRKKGKRENGKIENENIGTLEKGGKGEVRK